MLDWNREINPHGCGIGLTVSKRFIELLGGSIWIESKYGVGTSVHFRIPLLEFFENRNNNSEETIEMSFLNISQSISFQTGLLSRNKVRTSITSYASRK